jgi:hypothetical protein
MSPTAAVGTLRNLPLYPITCISLNSLAPVLSAHLSMEPAGKPREIFGLCPINPRAKKALLALAAILLFLQSFYYNK